MLTGRAIDYAERAQFYEVEYATTVDHDFLASLVTDGVRRVLEIPAGVGRNLGWLAASGGDVVMADLEPEMIAQLSVRIAGLGAQSRVSALVADLRYLSLPYVFDLVIVPQGGLQLLPSAEDALQALGRLRQHLAPTGTLVLDLATFEAGVDGDEEVRPSYFDPTVPNGQLVHEWVRPLPDGGWLTRLRTQHLGSDTLTTTFFYKIESQDGATSESSFVMESRRYQYEQVVLLAETVGLSVREVYRNYRGDLYRGSGHRMILVLTAG